MYKKDFKRFAQSKGLSRQFESYFNMINRISASNTPYILEEREISVGEGETKKVLINGFLVINREKLNALSDEILASWVRRGIISFIDAH